MQLVTPRVLVSLVVLLLAVSVHAAPVTGRVVDSAGQPVAGAVVALRGAAAGTVRTRSAADGSFSLAAEPGPPATLEVSATGYAPAAVALGADAQPVEVVLVAAPVFSGAVEVTGTRVAAGIDPVTVTNLGPAQIERQNWGQDVPLLLTHAPGLYAYNDNGNGLGYSYFSLRGFDMRRTAVTLNGVPLNDAHSHSVFFVDLADFLTTTGDVQVQRGVGGSLYGHSALGGAVDLRTRSPLPEQRLRLTSSFGSWATRRLSLEVDSGRNDDGWSAAFRWSEQSSDGYRDQAWLDAWSYFATVEHVGDDATTRITLFGGPEDTHLAYLGVSRAYLNGEVSGNRDRDRRHNPLGWAGEVDHFIQPHYQLQHLWQAAPDLVLDTTVFYFPGDGYFDQYEAGASFADYGLGEAAGDLTTRRSVDEWDGGLVPRLELTHHDGRGRLQAGIAVRLHHGRHLGEVTWVQAPPPGLEPNHAYYDYQLGKTSLQPFVQESFQLDPRWTLAAGLTWTSHRYRMDEDRFNGVEVDASSSFLLPRLGATFAPVAGWSLFANLSRGAREPAFRDIYDPQDPSFGAPRELDPEDLTDLELGARHEWRDGFAAVNLYWLDFDNAMVYGAGLDNNGVPRTANGAVMEQVGAELEAAWNPSPLFGARGTLAWADAEFSDFVEYDWYGTPVDQSGNAVGFVPELLGGLELATSVGPVEGLLTVRHAGQFFLDNTENQRQDPAAHDDPAYVDRVNQAFTTVDLALRADLGGAVADLLHARAARLDLRVNNLLDSEHTTFGYTDYPEPVWIPGATRGWYAGVTVDW